jgi:hypothetical protein
VITNMHDSADTVLAASQAVERAADSLRGSVDGFSARFRSSPDLPKYFRFLLGLRKPQA